MFSFSLDYFNLKEEGKKKKEYKKTGTARRPGYYHVISRYARVGIRHASQHYQSVNPISLYIHHHHFVLGTGFLMVP